MAVADRESSDRASPNGTAPDAAGEKGLCAAPIELGLVAALAEWVVSAAFDSSASTDVEGSLLLAAHAKVAVGVADSNDVHQTLQGRWDGNARPVAGAPQ